MPLASMGAQTDQVRLSFLHWLLAQDQARAQWYVSYRRYYDGDQQTQLSDRQRRYLQLSTDQDFVDNYCSVVADALAERLTITGFETDDDAETLWQWWQVNRMDRTQGQVHLAAVRDGDGYLLVDWDNAAGVPRFTFELAWDGTEGVKLHYSPEHRNVPWFASKRWRIDQGEEAGQVRRLNLYWPDRIEKYISDSEREDGNWQQHREKGEAAWPLPWVDGQGQPLGVPLMHWKNMDQGYNHGTSEIKGVIPLQNALNKSVIDMLAVADASGFPIPYVIGDDPGTMELMPGVVFFAENSETKVGVLPAANPEGLIATVNTFVIEIARTSRTPLSYFQITGQRAAEGTLQQQEVVLVSKAENRQVSFADPWADMMAMGRRLNNTFGSEEMNEEPAIEPIWASAETRNERAHLEGLKIKAELGVPLERLLVEMGYDADTIVTILAQAGAQLQATSNIGGELLRAFEGGGL